MALKLFISHLVVSVFAVFFLINLAANDFQFYLILLFTGLIYFASGYIFTRERRNWRNYFPVAVVGIILWLACYLLSPHSTNYKREANAGLWLFYELYVMVKSPLNFIKSFIEPYSLNKDLITKLAVPIIISLLQFAGGLVKMTRLTSLQYKDVHKE